MADLNLPTPDRKPGDLGHATDTNTIIEAIKALNSKVDTLPGGLQGPKGDKGDKGDAVTGPAGPVGPPGPVGSSGPAGAKGDPGADSTIPGPQGNPGPQGIQGPAGRDSTVPGPQGLKGDKGDTGTGFQLKGVVSNVSLLPTTGNTSGDAWMASDTNHVHIWDGAAWDDVGALQGPKGDVGPTGPTGPASTVPGPKGDPGVQGQQGIQGVAGPKGDTGAAGPAGTNARWFTSGHDGFTDPGDVTGMHNGDYFLYPTSGDVFLYSAGAWAYSANIKGPKGDTGAQGAQGPVGPAPTGMVMYRGDYMPNAYQPGDAVRWHGDLWICVNAVAAGGSAPSAPDWERAADGLPLSTPTDLGKYLSVDGAGDPAWVTLAVPPAPDLTPYALKAGAAFTGTVTAVAPATGKAVRNVWFASAPPTAADGADGDMWVVTA